MSNGIVIAGVVLALGYLTLILAICRVYEEVRYLVDLYESEKLRYRIATGNARRWWE